MCLYYLHVCVLEQDVKEVKASMEKEEFLAKAIKFNGMKEQLNSLEKLHQRIVNMHKYSASD